MSVDAKVRIGLLVVSLAVTAVAVLASAHGLHIGFLDEIGGGTPH